MRILISGGGIAGLTLAYWLHRYGLRPIVIEQASGIRSDGNGLDFYGPGYEVAERMGIIPHLKDRQMLMDAMAFVDERGKVIAKLDTKLMYKVMDGKYLELMRRTLEKVVYETIEQKVEIRFGRSLSSIDQGIDSVRVRFNDGTAEEFDLVVGADGIHSNTRELVFGPEERFLYPMGYDMASYTLPDRYNFGSVWKTHTQPGRSSAAYASDRPGEIVTLFMYQARDQKRIPREQRLAHLHRIYAGMGWLTQQMLDDAPDSAAIFMDSVVQVRMPTWHHGRVVLVGDACACPTLLSGQGASLAMTEAFFLAQALHEASDYQSAFKRYEQQVRPRVELQQKRAAGFAKTYIPNSQVEMWVQNVIMKVVFHEVFSGILRQQFGAQGL